MDQKNLLSLPSRLVLPVLWVVLGAVSLLPNGDAAIQSPPQGYPKDNSDWWSYTGRSDSDREEINQQRELPPSNFTILGLSLDDEIFDRAIKKLGRASVVMRGDASVGRTQICYSSVGKQDKAYLIFEKGEINDAFYLFTGGPDWDASDRCVASDLVTGKLSTGSGLRLGQTSAQVKAILGKPSSASPNKITYSLMAQKKTSTADLEKVRKQNPGLSEAELRTNYEFYTLSAYVEGRFVKDRLVYLAISKTESF